MNATAALTLRVVVETAAGLAAEQAGLDHARKQGRRSVEGLFELGVEALGWPSTESYGYYITDSYPWVMNCFSGTPSPSFMKG